MDGGIYGCPAAWKALLPPGAVRVRGKRTLRKRRWGVLALTPEGCGRLYDTGGALSCELLLLPGDCAAERLPHLQTPRAVSYGLSPRDSLTFSGLREPVLCVQRTLRVPGGATIEPGEIPVPWLPAPVEAYLPLLGLWLLSPSSVPDEGRRRRRQWVWGWG